MDSGMFSSFLQLTPTAATHVARTVTDRYGALDNLTGRRRPSPEQPEPYLNPLEREWEGVRRAERRIIRRAERHVRTDSLPPICSESYTALMAFSARPGSNAYNMREAYNPPVRPDWFVIEREHLVPNAGEREDDEGEDWHVFNPSVHLPLDSQLEGRSGKMMLVLQIWSNMMSYHHNYLIIGAPACDLVWEFVVNCLEWGDHEEVGTLVPQATDNALQHAKRRRHFHRRWFARIFKWHGVNVAREIVGWTPGRIEEAWTGCLARNRTFHLQYSFDGMLSSPYPLWHWGEYNSSGYWHWGGYYGQDQAQAVSQAEELVEGLQAGELEQPQVEEIVVRQDTQEAGEEAEQECAEEEDYEANFENDGDEMEEEEEEKEEEEEGEDEDEDTEEAIEEAIEYGSGDRIVLDFDVDTDEECLQAEEESEEDSEEEEAKPEHQEQDDYDDQSDFLSVSDTTYYSWNDTSTAEESNGEDEREND